MRGGDVGAGRGTCSHQLERKQPRTALPALPAHHHVCVRHVLHREAQRLAPRRRLQLAAADADEPKRAGAQDGAVQAGQVG